MSSAIPNSCRGASGRGYASASRDLIVADLIIGFSMFRERFTSRVTLDPPHRIDVAYTEGPFKYLNNHWIFERVPGGCRIDFFVDFEFKSRILQRVIEMLFHEAVRRMVAAFEDRARAALRRPGTPSGGQTRGVGRPPAAVARRSERRVETGYCRASAASSSRASISAARRMSARLPGKTRRSTRPAPSLRAMPR